MSDENVPEKPLLSLTVKLRVKENKSNNIRETPFLLLSKLAHSLFCRLLFREVTANVVVTPRTVSCNAVWSMKQLTYGSPVDPAIRPIIRSALQSMTGKRIAKND